MKDLYTKALTLYKDIDKAVENHYKSHTRKAPCAKGCASCCSQFFEISELEFMLISEAIHELPLIKQKEIASRSEILFSLFQENWSSFYSDFFTPSTINLITQDYYKHPERFKVMIPCVFLSPEGQCDIYERRPLTCRTTGVGFQQLINIGAVCNYIKHGITTPLWQADLRGFHQGIDEIRWLIDPDKPELFKRQYPMFYYVYDLFILKHKN